MVGRIVIQVKAIYQDDLHRMKQIKKRVRKRQNKNWRKYSSLIDQMYKAPEQNYKK
jgi:sulfate adenylyltransferase subunit 1 (EFTu-like GTPase family)